MKVPAIALALLGAAASATAEQQQLRAGQSIDADSVHAHRLLSSANTRALENQNGEEDTSWMVNYSLQFDSCHEITAVGGEAGGREGGAGAGVQRLVKLKLCPKDTCGRSCKNGAEYLVEMREFLETYMDAKEEMNEQQCEYQNQVCENQCENGYYNNQNDGDNDNDNNQNNNNNNNEEYCLMNCLSDAGYGECYDGDYNNNNNNNNNQAEELDYGRFAECESLYEDNNNGYYNGNSGAYVGAYCSKGGSAINLGVFTDSSCTIKGDNSLFESVYYTSLPYTTKSIIGNECLSCDASEYEYQEDDGDNNNNNNYNYDYEVSEICEEVHERSAKCEENLSVKSSYYQPHTESCTLIHSTLSSLESITKSNGKSLTTARAFAWIFFFTTLGAVGYIFYLHQNKNGKIDLSMQGVLGGTSA